MSDFDREAERERLREKYERDQEKRESTERMSELLLKGATMTDAHCGNCGDPVFRYEGEEFCPTCQERVAADVESEEGSADAREEGDATAAASERAADAPEPDAASDAEGADGTTEPDTAAADSQSARDRGDAETNQSAGTADRDANGVGTPASPAAANESTRQSRNRARQSQEPTQPSRTEGSSRQPSRAEQSSPSRSVAEQTGDAGEGVGAARESLTRTLLAQARKAENCEDPRRAKDHLAAAREAAEALAALSY